MTQKGKNIQQVGSGGIQGNLSINVGRVFSITGNHNHIISFSEQNQNLAEVATEVKQLLQQLEQVYPMGTTSEKMLFAAEAMRQIDTNPRLHQRLLNTLKAGGEAFKQLLNNHPVANFLIGALKEDLR
jgi:hypothetical protein